MGEREETTRVPSGSELLEFEIDLRLLDVWLALDELELEQDELAVIGCAVRAAYVRGYNQASQEPFGAPSEALGYSLALAAACEPAASEGSDMESPEALPS